ncbi:acyltransferase family protein [Aeromicrobium alkaliterrae]|uniref:Acyltransferase family protein n=1 Tax=Aeromicrobium alkaliterrae TaxID=302168 RepID=A0ABN2KD78_9ACTN
MSALAPLPVTPSAPKERVAYLDNARYWVMLLVVVGHSLTEFVVMDSARGVYTWIYAFHMPLFILISGYTARHYVGDVKQIRRIVSTLVVPYLIVELSLQLITRHYTGEPAQLMVLSPQWIGWFMAALILWRLTTPIWRALRYPITTSIIISLGSGLIDIPNVLAIHKTVAFLPFYVIGLHMTRERFLQLGTMRLRVASAVLLSGLFVLCQFVRFPQSGQWLLWKNSYVDMGVTFGEGLLIRSGLIVLGLVMTFAALSLVPRGRSWTTAQGERTFYCYLLHGFVIIWLDRHYHLWDQLEPYGATAVAGLIVASVILANLLMTRPVARAFRPIFEPKLTWLFRPIDESPKVKIPT